MKLGFEIGDSKKYKVKVIQNSAVYINNAKGYLSSLYYFVAWKRYFEEENTWKPLSIVWHLKKPINSFHKKHLEKTIETFSLINFAPLMAKLIVKPSKPITKQK